MEYIYGALLLHKLGQPVNEDNLKKVISATGAEVDDTKIKTLIASLQGVDIAAELENASMAVAAPTTSGGGAEEAKAEEKKDEEEKKPEEAAAGLASLFG
ncbi:50S ribosomal protein P1 [Candidatus Pacearchaeota archaeon CG10_big_fil_rev_8_21_14_0_10_35_219]|nr:50S ribosomal protein P1 [Candidatus Pacearchaeota archaeon]OIO42326.1 MAG: 50S ribosomal protein P1 [Candidatus Pacearchaeota archaeon CG1_02_35_32]PIO07439.1 MAG: 50S ribosomal protein P1 [Candidatus Pacearchaeota archaeon CG10_big_fil_rev_8_21_14_0_10_35_219]PIY81245.1 MAG: 50S ribosomal protein P1 [Candidatus Pacearchaeota archaeon CG_4_10_14_0_8_um_filter_35_169]PIZ80174.1 MAG: 50S ribosomal protein P1 [Candidatus Pacearchaeota archaeon CG_4_10_14_0_2_um_filter_35_33]PJA69561.1 MAG: 50